MYISKNSILRVFISLILVLSLTIPTKVLALGNNNMEVSTWLWNTRDIIKSSNKILNFLSTKGVKNVYLQINYDVNISEYKKFISAASAKNINVQALNGSPSWVFPQGQEVQKRFFDWLNNYQNSVAINERFKGVHLDVEPYLNPLYSTSPNVVIQGYQDMLLSSLGKSNMLGLPMAIDITFWYDNVKYSTSYGEGILVEWIFRNIKDINIMAYRNSAVGDNGIIKLTSNELNLASIYNNNVIISVETRRSSEGNYLSFYSLGEAKMSQELDKVYDYYSGYSNLKGFAIHDVKNWMILQP